MIILSFVQALLRYRGHMWKPEEPNGQYGRWGQVGSAVLTFGILMFVIVIVMLDFLLSSPTWVLGIACVLIAVFSITWGFTVVDEDELEVAATSDDDEKLHWVFDRPVGFWGWTRRFVSLWFTFAGLLILSKLVLINLMGLGESAWVIAGFPLLALALALEFLDIADSDDPYRSSGSSSATGAYARVKSSIDRDLEARPFPQSAPNRGNANARFHQRDHQA